MSYLYRDYGYILTLMKTFAEVLTFKKIDCRELSSGGVSCSKISLYYVYFVFSGKNDIRTS